MIEVMELLKFWENKEQFKRAVNFCEEFDHALCSYEIKRAPGFHVDIYFHEGKIDIKTSGVYESVPISAGDLQEYFRFYVLNDQEGFTMKLKEQVGDLAKQANVEFGDRPHYWDQ